jgi:hypothetical protein
MNPRQMRREHFLNGSILIGLSATGFLVSSPYPVSENLSFFYRAKRKRKRKRKRNLYPR